MVMESYVADAEVELGPVYELVSLVKVIME